MPVLLLSRSARGPAVAALRRALAEQLGPDADDFPGLARGDAFDAKLEAAVRRWQAGVGLVADGLLGPRCLALLGLAPQAAALLPLHEVAARFPATKLANIERYWPYVDAALQALGLVERPLVLAALATIRAETEGFLPIAEAPSAFNTLPGQPAFSAYEGRATLGNEQSGDGARFKGRGFVQLTGRANYTRLGEALGLDLLAEPERANAPELAALLLAQFLKGVAPRLRKALAARDFAAARKLVNGGSHGLARFESVFKLAAPAQASARASASAKRAPTTARKDALDLRDRPYLPPPISLMEAFPSDAEVRGALPRYTGAGLILNQGQEGACTGFGLACVVNHLRWRAAERPTAFESVSPHMLYRFARRYDEYAGEDYEGSSCRGALKAWFKHGVCLHGDWPASSERPRYGYTRRATEQTLGVYYRVALRAITDLQAAIQQVGAVYASAHVHEGWYQLPARSTPPSGHAELPLIEFKGEPPGEGGHAFALVGFNRQGFVVQNSWGPAWGAGGFAVLSYADWLTNGMDAWVAALGVPGVVEGRIEATRAAGAAAAQARPDWWSEEQAYRHSVVLGDDGRMHRYLSEDEPTRTLLHQVTVLPDEWFRRSGSSGPKKLLIYAHGGLNSEGDAIQRARALGRHALANGAYPLFMVWKTGLLETLKNLLRGGGPAAGLAEALTDRSDALIEKTVGRSLVRPIWSEMKGNAELAFEAGRGGDLLVSALKQLGASWGKQLEIHLVGHSAGAIFLGHLLSSLARREALGLVRSVELYAPACSLQFANRHYAAHAELLEGLHIQLLSERLEREDSVAGIYRKSLLWLVSNALEADRRTPLLGLAAAWNADYNGWEGSSSTAEVLRQWRRAVDASGLAQRLSVLDANEVPSAPGQRIRANHGSFDNDLAVVTATLTRICGAPLGAPPGDLRGF